MSEGYAVFLLMNNYFHDVATAMPLACAVVLALLVRSCRADMDDVSKAIARRLYRGMLGMVWFSVAWIVASGAVRIATLDAFEWKNFAEKGLLSGLVVKYVIAAALMLLGGSLTAAFARKLRTVLR